MATLRFVLVFWMCLAWHACFAGGGAFPEAQQLVEKIIEQHPNVVRLTIHAVPTGGSVNRIVACNLPDKLGKASDPEDLQAMQSNKTTVLREGNDLDVTVPIPDREGKVIAATGVTLLRPAGRAGVEEAQGIARELAEAIRAAGHPLW